jgi:CheY-like chemotaxis protein
MPLGNGGTKHLDGSGTAATLRPPDDDLSSLHNELPEKLNVLFIDDDNVLRKLFSRSIKNVVPEWSIREAASGEAAIQLVENEEFDLIFCDMYMASVEKTLLGTETVSILRSKGITSRICGLSANDKEEEFKDAGADAFLFKPIPCDAQRLRQTLRQILSQDGHSNDQLFHESLLPNF